MNFLEKDLEDIIYETDRDFLEERGLEIRGKVFRQKRIGNYGIADLISVERPFYVGGENHSKMIITIYELKQNKINYSTLSQVIRYGVGINRYLKKRGFHPRQFKIKFVIIGRELNGNDDFVYAEQMFENLTVMTYEYKADGIYFNDEVGYYLKEEGFKKEANRVTLYEI